MAEMLLRSRTGVESTVLLDDEDLDRVQAVGSWYVDKKGYVLHSDNQLKTRFRLHRFVLGFGPSDPLVDHKNRNTLDNRRTNLRPADSLQNGANRALRTSGSSRYRGVYWHKNCKLWCASQKVNYKRIHVGSFLTEEAAAEAIHKFRVEHGLGDPSDG